MSAELGEPNLEQPDYSCPTCTDGCDDGEILERRNGRMVVTDWCDCLCHPSDGKRIFDAMVGDEQYKDSVEG